MCLAFACTSWLLLVLLGFSKSAVFTHSYENPPISPYSTLRRPYCDSMRGRIPKVNTWASGPSDPTGILCPKEANRHPIRALSGTRTVIAYRYQVLLPVSIVERRLPFLGLVSKLSLPHLPPSLCKIRKGRGVKARDTSKRTGGTIHASWCSEHLVRLGRAFIRFQRTAVIIVHAPIA
jgi:hypothetical protein